MKHDAYCVPFHPPTRSKSMATQIAPLTDAAYTPEQAVLSTLR